MSNTNKELDYFNIAGELQAKSYQFSVLGLTAMQNCIYSSEELALRHIENLINDLEGYEELLKKKIAEQKREAEEARLREKYEEGWR